MTTAELRKQTIEAKQRIAKLEKLHGGGSTPRQAPALDYTPQMLALMNEAVGRLFTPEFLKLINDPSGQIRCARHFAQHRAVNLITESQKLAISAGRPADSVKLSACLVPYGKVSRRWDFGDGGGAQEVYEPGCFRGAGVTSDVAVTFNHSPMMILGRTEAGTAVFYEDAEGLKCEVEPPDTSWADDLVCSMDRGDITDMVAAFYVLDRRTERTKDGHRVTVIKRAQLVQAAVSVWPMFDARSSVQVTNKNQLAVGSFYLGPQIEKGQVIQ